MLCDSQSSHLHTCVLVLIRVQAQIGNGRVLTVKYAVFLCCQIELNSKKWAKPPYLPQQHTLVLGDCEGTVFNFAVFHLLAHVHIMCTIVHV